MKNDGTVWAWGDNDYGKLGDNSTITSDTPVQVQGPKGEGYLNLGYYVAYDYYLPYFISDSDYWTGVGLKDTSKSFTALVTAAVYESTGTLLAAESKSINPAGQTAFMMSPGEGWVRISSNEPLMGLGFIAMSDDERLMFDIPFVAEPERYLYIPHVAQDATWDTTVFVCNPNGTETTMYLSFFDAGGDVQKVKGYTLPANGSGTYPLSGFLGATASYDRGSVKISATQGVAAFALYNDLKSGGHCYAGINAVPSPPVLSSYEYYIPYCLADSDYWTGVALKNGSDTAGASVTVTGIGQDGSSFSSETKAIPASGQTAFMMSPGEGWVRISSNEPLMGLGFIAMSDDERLMFDIPFVAEPERYLYIPHVAQDATWDTTVFVCNPNGTETTMYLSFFDAGGDVQKVKGYTLPANGSGTYPLSGFLGATASYDRGSVKISATQGVAAFALYHNLKTGDRSYAGISAVAPTCTYSLNPASASFGASGGTGTVAVTTSSPTCSWTALSNVAWMIHVTAGSSGTGNGTVTYSVEPYSGTGSRSGTLTIAGHTFTVTQTDCTFTISPISPPIASFNGDGGTGTVAVTASSPGCRWTAASNTSWLQVTYGLSGTGNGTVSYSVDPYYSSLGPFSTRRGTLTIAWETFTVTQTGTFP